MLTPENKINGEFDALEKSKSSANYTWGFGAEGCVNIDEDKRAAIVIQDYYSHIKAGARKLENQNVYVIRYAREDKSELEKEIERSEYILELDDDWDEEGACKYKPETWQRAVDYLKGYLHWMRKKNGIDIDVPKISHGPTVVLMFYGKRKNIDYY